ncbi:MAG: hypothetical protein Q7K65_03495 [Candidatus Buchananbacteria bacterium]|nr:hypothetical protein [Candidatus Buchananbacteria bacterium]
MKTVSLLAIIICICGLFIGSALLLDRSSGIGQILNDQEVSSTTAVFHYIFWFLSGGVSFSATIWLLASSEGRQKKERERK